MQIQMHVQVHPSDVVLSYYWCASSKLFFIPSTVVIQKTVTLATPSEEPVTVSMLYLSSDLKVILLYLENSSDSAGTFKLRGCL